MVTRYLVFNTLTEAQNASRNDWIVRILKRTIEADDTTAALWGIISNSAGTIGVITDDIPLQGLSDPAKLVDKNDPTVAAVLAAQVEISNII